MPFFSLKESMAALSRHLAEPSDKFISPCGFPCWNHSDEGREPHSPLENSIVSEKSKPRLKTINSPFLAKTKSCFDVKCMSTLPVLLRHSERIKKCRFTCGVALKVRRFRLHTHRSVSKNQSKV